MQVVYALGTAAEDGSHSTYPSIYHIYPSIHLSLLLTIDLPLPPSLLLCSAVFSGYVYYVVLPAQYQRATSYLKAAALSASVLAGILGDLLVVEGGTSLDTLMWISCVSVCVGFAVGLYVLRPTAAAAVRRRGEGGTSSSRHDTAVTNRTKTEGGAGGVDRQAEVDDPSADRTSRQPAVVRFAGDESIHGDTAATYYVLVRYMSAHSLLLLLVCYMSVLIQQETVRGGERVKTDGPLSR